MIKYREFVNELKEIKWKGLDSDMKGSKVSEDKYWDRIYTFDEYRDYDKASKKMAIFVAHNSIWKTDYNKDKLQIFIRFEK